MLYTLKLSWTFDRLRDRREFLSRTRVETRKKTKLSNIDPKLTAHLLDMI